LKYLNTKYKIFLRNAFEILLSNTSTLRPKIQNTKYLLAIVFEIQNTQIRSYNTQLVNVRIGFEQQKCFEHVVRQFVAFRTAEVEAFAAVDEVVRRASAVSIAIRVLQNSSIQ